MFRGFNAIVYKETIHILRDPKTLLLMLVIPGIQLTIFGYAIQMDVKHIPTAYYNLDGREASRELLDSFENTGYFDFVGQAFSDDELTGMIVDGHAKVGVKIPPDYSDSVALGRRAEVQVLIDGSDSTVAMQALNVSNAIALRKSFTAIQERFPGRSQPIESRPRVLFNPDMKTANFMVPGLIGIVMQVVTMFLTAFAVVREKENGTLEQLMVTPVSRLGLLGGKLMPYACIGAFEVCMVVLLMRFLFQVPIAGSLALLAGFSVLFLVTSLGLGLMISTIASNQVQAIQIAFLVMLPSVLLSGFMFPQESMPAPIWAIGQALPVTYFIRILRGIILRDAGFMQLWPQGIGLIVIASVLLTVSAGRFRKTLG
ncbi:MAG: ABC transporter permease [Candidatus Hydrogenedentes bacterium]|nr:ABC transporter permease [Candidatus Hydrogenedentota bacterium]